MTDAAPPLLAGRYRLGRRLGRGGMSEVYRAVDTRLQRPVAVKVFRSNADESSRRRFEDEARLLARLSHPGLVTVHDFGAESGDGEPFLVMQLVEGRTLTNVIESGTVEPEDVLELGRRIAVVLAYVHENGIVHRDVKPSNVLITDDEQVFLADFGISRLADAVGRMTDSGIIMGSAHYMAPEQVRDEEIGYPADLYSLALVLLECLTGRAEYDGTKAEAAVARLTRKPRIPESLPEPLAGTLRAMTADDPDDRPSAARCVRLLSGEISPPAAKPEVDPTLPVEAAGEEPARRRRWWPWLGVPIAAAVLGAVFLLLPVESAPDLPMPPPVTGPPGVDRLPADLANLTELVDE
ncbi:serine/threonine-protein kinase [Saccharopolyspora gloriosae]|uniref:non-specific serine/threonine protein kinase n=1 Tax=Saccharopolyspora gloriosae TaxID=455344 RepID=A0A840NE47_9PSEU|nr:serine/threonine-protein kinase [Saccharopolyspora gloriosae]MBB5068498.1 serine/threonine protein kinase [Saccharopolyspora gloriosae]